MTLYNNRKNILKMKKNNKLKNTIIKPKSMKMIIYDD